MHLSQLLVVTSVLGIGACGPITSFVVSVFTWLFPVCLCVCDPHLISNQLLLLDLQILVLIVSAETFQISPNTEVRDRWNFLGYNSTHCKNQKFTALSLPTGSLSLEGVHTLTDGSRLLFLSALQQLTDLCPQSPCTRLCQRLMRP
jgi:hypothetical protein